MQDIKTHIRIIRMAFIVLPALFTAAVTVAQPFTPITANLAGAGRSCTAWGDFDNDGDLDLFIAGLGINDERVAAIYRNDEGSFTALNDTIPGYKESAAAWGDMENDGDLDLLVAGNTVAGDRAVVYRNDSGSFTEVDLGLPAVQTGEVCWMDFDGDGDLDIFLTGSWYASLYENRGSSFEPFPQAFGLFGSSSADWGDFDNDGDLDLLILGDSGAGAVTKIFRNDSGSFADINAGFAGLMSGAADWVDYNNDGLCDVAIAGYNDALEAEFFLYKNLGFGQFTYAFTGIEGFATGDMDWGDYDNDGDADLVMSGKATGCGAVVAGIYRNDGSDLFYKMSYTILLAIRCSVQWADFENDGDLDFLLAGMDYGEYPHTILYRNDGSSNLFASNSSPSIPLNTGEAVDDDLVTLSWDESTDAQTLQDALTYNIRMGTTSGGGEVVPAMADPATGFRRVAAPGNASSLNSVMIMELEPGTYYWSVQALDQGFLGSEFSPERYFTIGTIGIDNPYSYRAELTFCPNPANGQIAFMPGLLKDHTEIMISDISGRCHLKMIISGRENMVDVSGLAPGIYLLNVKDDSSSVSSKLVVK
jgi:hypothetical protein